MVEQEQLLTLPINSQSFSHKEENAIVFIVQRVIKLLFLQIKNENMVKLNTKK